MADIKATDHDGGANIGDGEKKLALSLQDMATDFETLRSFVVALTAKLDADGGITDTNYAATLDILPAGILTKKV